MSSPISPETHKEYKHYSSEDITKLIEFIRHLEKKAIKEGIAPYTPSTFINHARCNINRVNRITTGNVPANILFWLYRACISMNTVCPIELPHICKLPLLNGEKFYVATKQEWAAHRATVFLNNNRLNISDHAKLGYLTRVKNYNLEQLLEEFPIAKLLASKGTRLEDGRTAHNIGDFVYVMDGNTCITVLDKGMLTT